MERNKQEEHLYELLGWLVEASCVYERPDGWWFATVPDAFEVEVKGFRCPEWMQKRLPAVRSALNFGCVSFRKHRDREE